MPRPTVAKFLHYVSKEKILQAYRQERLVTVRVHRIQIFQDYSEAGTAKKKIVCTYVQILHYNNKCQLQYPAKLKVTVNG